jgi:hypothetical protein
MGTFFTMLAQGAGASTAAAGAAAAATGSFMPLAAATSYGAVAMSPIVGGLGAGVATAATAGSFLGLSSNAWSGISTASSMMMDVQAGNAQAANYARQAQQEEFAAKDQEIKRRRSLMASLASQNAYRGASGVRAFEGSPAAMMKSDIDLFEYDNLMGKANTEMRTSALMESGKYAKQSGYTSAGTSLLEYGSKRAKRGSLPKKTKGTY